MMMEADTLDKLGMTPDAVSKLKTSKRREFSIRIWKTTTSAQCSAWLCCI